MIDPETSDVLRDAQDTPADRVVPPDIPLSMVDRHHVRNLYLCVRLDGMTPEGEPAYCYFGIFVDQWLRLLKHLQDHPDANPKDFGGTVLCRAIGRPTPEIEAFMQMKFSCAPQDAPIVLEISRS